MSTKSQFNISHSNVLNHSTVKRNWRIQLIPCSASYCLSVFLLENNPKNWQETVLKKRNDFKLASLCFKPLNGSAPTYLSDLLHLYIPSLQLRSSADTRVFRIPSFRTKSRGQCSFSYQAPTTWNKLPASIRYASSVSSFKSSLKTFLFSKTFSSVPLPWGACVCQGACMCARVCVYECGCICLLFVYLNFSYPNICKRA